MKYLLLTFLFLFPNKEVFTQTDYSNFKHFFGFQINSGVTIFSLTPLKNDFNNYVNEIKSSYNLPLEVQHLYPSNISWSGYLFWYFSPNVSLIIGPEYNSTRAFSRYEDYSGTLDIKSELNEIYLSLGIRVHFPESKILQPLFGFNFGLTQFKIENSTDINIGDGFLHTKEEFKISDYGYSIDTYVGFNYDIKIAVLQFSVSYKYLILERFLIEPNNFNLRIGIQKGIFK